MKSTDELVTELADREAIRDLPVRYCDCVWQNDLKTMVELFSGSARRRANDGGSAQGRRSEVRSEHRKL